MIRLKPPGRPKIILVGPKSRLVPGSFQKKGKNNGGREQADTSLETRATRLEGDPDQADTQADTSPEIQIRAISIRIQEA